MCEETDQTDLFYESYGHFEVFGRNKKFCVESVSYFFFHKVRLLVLLPLVDYMSAQQVSFVGLIFFSGVGLSFGASIV